jgi:hypothetical protein
MSDDRSHTGPTTDVPISVDIYGIKVETTSKQDGLGDPEPTSWPQVAQQLHRHLMRLATAPTRFVVQVLESATELVRGLGRLPNAVARRLEHAHYEADKREESKQIAAQENIQPENLAVEHALRVIECIIAKYAAQGLDAYVDFTPQGKIVIVIGTPPNSSGEVLKAINEAQQSLLLEASSEPKS